MAAAQRDELFGEPKQVVVDRRPVEPRDLIVLALGVVIAALSTADLVTSQQQWDTSRKQQRPAQPFASAVLTAFASASARNGLVRNGAFGAIRLMESVSL